MHPPGLASAISPRNRPISEIAVGAAGLIACFGVGWRCGIRPYSGRLLVARSRHFVGLVGQTNDCWDTATDHFPSDFVVSVKCERTGAPNDIGLSAPRSMGHRWDRRTQ